MPFSYLFLWILPAKLHFNSLQIFHSRSRRVPLLIDAKPITEVWNAVLMLPKYRPCLGESPFLLCYMQLSNIGREIVAVSVDNPKYNTCFYVCRAGPQVQDTCNNPIKYKASVLLVNFMGIQLTNFSTKGQSVNCNSFYSGHR